MLRLLNTFFSGYSSHRLTGTRLYLTHSHKPAVVYLSSFSSKKSLLKIHAYLQSKNPDRLYLMNNTPLARKTIQKIPELQPLYFLEKKGTALFFYDRRYVKTKGRPYLLPPISLNPSAFFLREGPIAGEDSLFPERNTSFYCDKDSTHRLRNPLYREAIERRTSSRDRSLTEFLSFLSKNFYEKLKEKLDKSSS